VKAYFMNLMWQPGETAEFRASDHIRAIHRHAGGKRQAGRERAPVQQP